MRMLHKRIDLEHKVGRLESRLMPTGLNLTRLQKSTLRQLKESSSFSLPLQRIQSLVVEIILSHARLNLETDY
jgi:hypothetical protein